jgi:hypothetical protein
VLGPHGEDDLSLGEESIGGAERGGGGGCDGDGCYGGGMVHLLLSGIRSFSPQVIGMSPTCENTRVHPNVPKPRT